MRCYGSGGLKRARQAARAPHVPLPGEGLVCTGLREVPPLKGTCPQLSSDPVALSVLTAGHVRQASSGVSVAQPGAEQVSCQKVASRSDLQKEREREEGTVEEINPHHWNPRKNSSRGLDERETSPAGAEKGPRAS